MLVLHLFSSVGLFELNKKTGSLYSAGFDFFYSEI